MSIKDVKYFDSYLQQKLIVIKIQHLQNLFLIAQIHGILLRDFTHNKRTIFIANFYFSCFYLDKI